MLQSNWITLNCDRHHDQNDPNTPTGCLKSKKTQLNSKRDYAVSIFQLNGKKGTLYLCYICYFLVTGQRLILSHNYTNVG